MKRALNIFLLLALALNRASLADDTTFESVLGQGLSEARKAEKILLIAVESPGCGPCAALAGVLASPEARPALAPYLVRKFEQSTADQRLAQMGVDGFPALLFFETSGTLLDRIDGFIGAERTLAELRRIATGRETIPALRADLSRTPASPSLLLALARKTYRSDPAEGIDLLKRARESAAGVKDRELLAQVAVATVRAYYRSGNLSEVLTQFTALLDQFGDTKTAENAATECLPALLALRPSQALWPLVRASEKTTHPRQRAYLRELIRELHMKSLASVLEESLTAEQDSEAILEAAWFCVDHRVSEVLAESLVSRALEATNRSARSTELLATLRESQGRTSEAMAALKEAISAVSDTAERERLGAKLARLEGVRRSEGDAGK